MGIITRERSTPKDLQKGQKFAKKVRKQKPVVDHVDEIVLPPVEVDREPSEEEVMMMMLQKMQENQKKDMMDEDDKRLFVKVNSLVSGAITDPAQLAAGNSDLKAGIQQLLYKA